MEALKLYWLGLPRVVLAERPAKLETRKSVALLAYLSTGADRCQREAVATVFWPEANQQRALGNLRRTLASLNSRVPGWIEADRDSIGLRKTSKLWCDVQAFHELLERVRQFSNAGSELSEECRAALENALKLYRGEFLDGLNLPDAPQFDEWEFFQRAELQGELAGLLERLARTYSDTGKGDQAIETALRWTALDPLHEPASRMLMELYARSGKRSAALTQYEDLQRRLHEQPEREVEEATRRLYEEIRGQTAPAVPGHAPAYAAALPILKTKLYIPSPAPSRVKRADLLERLRRVERYRLTLISAPAGFGKTTLLAEWIAHTPLPVAWLSLDHGDNDIYHFLSYLIEALQGILEGVGADARQLLQSPQPPSPHIVLGSLISDLGKAIHPGVLVLDDYQYIVESAVHELMGYLLEHMPTNWHIVVASRADPPFRLGRLRAHGELLELRTRDLRFSVAEATEFLNQVMALGLSTEDIRALETRTEGWAVGLQLAALSLRGHERPTEFIRDFSGSNRFVLDYLVEEVLKRQPARIQSFLLQTSILDKLNGQLCDELMSDDWSQSGESSQGVLEDLERSNLFVLPLDDSRQWYRYHHLFADLLRSRLAQSRAIEVEGLHRRAAHWCESNGLFAEAVQHAFDAQDTEAAIQLIEKHAGDLIFSGRYATVLEWIRRLPPGRMWQRPWLCVWLGWAVLASGQLDGLEQLIQGARKGLTANPLEQPEFLEPKNEELTAQILGLEMALASLQEQHSRTIELALQLLGQLPDPLSRQRINALYTMGNAYYATGALAGAEQAYQEVRNLAPQSGFLLRHILATHRLAAIETVRGHLQQSCQLCQELISSLERTGQQDFFGMGDVYSDMARVYYEWNRVEDAHQVMARSILLSEATRVPMILVSSYSNAVPLLIGGGNLNAAEEMLEKGIRLVERYPVLPETRDLFESCRVRLWLAKNDVKSVILWSVERQQSALGPSGFQTELSDMAFARALIAQGKLDMAFHVLVTMADAAEAGGRNGRLAEILLLQTKVLWLEDHRDEALGLLRQSLELGAAGNFIRTYVDEGQWLEELLRLGIEHGEFGEYQSPAYISTLLKAFAG